MNNLLKVSAIFLMSLGAKQCVSFETVSLDDGQVEEEEVLECGIPGTKFQGGDLMDGPVWWTGAGDLSLSNKGGIYEITANGIGPQYTPFGQTLPGLDMRGDEKTGKLAVKITARSEGESYPTLALQFDDFEGFQTNAKRPTKRIHKGDEFKDYYFMLNDDVWVQSWPADHAVNACLLSKIMLFINPGGPAYTGKLFIKEIKIIPQSEAGEEEVVKLPKGKDGGMVDDFSGKIDKWWANGYKISKVDSTLKLEAENVGPKYEAFGRGFATINALHAYKLRVRARVEGEAAPELRIDLKDPDGYTTNSRPATNRILPSAPGQFRDYIFRFKDRWLQTYPDMKDVDGERIVEFVCFLNAGKAPFTGTIYIDEIEFINTGIPEGEKEEAKEEVKANTKPLKDDLDGNIYSWWNSDKFSLDQKEGALEVTANKVGSTEESFGRAFQSVDFTATPVLKVRLKAEKDCEVRIDLKDIDEHVTNSTPVTVKVKGGGKYQDYYFDYKGKFKQATPSQTDVKAKEILEAIFYINPQGPEYSGKVFVDSIESVKQVP